jgi:F-type H+-transporting ATPase subunit gamma
MPVNLRQIKSRIKVIDNTRKVTSALEMISVTKLNRTEKQLTGFKPYFLKLDEIFCRLTGCNKNLASPYLNGNNSPEICLVVIASDSGLCGVYNSNIIRFAEEFISSRGRDAVSLVIVGRRALNYFQKKGYRILESYAGLNGRYSAASCDEITAKVSDLFLKGDTGSVFVAYTHFKTALAHKPALVKFLKLEPPDMKEVDYIAEPGMEAILDSLIPGYLAKKMRLMIMESFAAEHSARTVAMKKATDNAEELSAKLELLRNKVRQAAITQDIMEIISSAEALKG